jgi:hypothetical protein
LDNVAEPHDPASTTVVKPNPVMIFATLRFF